MWRTTFQCLVMKPDDAMTKGFLVLQTQMPLSNALYIFPTKTVEEFSEIFCCLETTLLKNNHFFPAFSLACSACDLAGPAWILLTLLKRLWVSCLALNNIIDYTCVYTCSFQSSNCKTQAIESYMTKKTSALSLGCDTAPFKLNYSDHSKYATTVHRQKYQILTGVK